MTFPASPAATPAVTRRRFVQQAATGASLLLLPAATVRTARAAVPALPDLGLQPLPVFTDPGPEWAKSTRGAQGVAGIERTLKGRLWATWFASKSPGGVENPFSHVVLATSTDDGRSWVDPVLIVGPNHFIRAYDPCLWIDPLGRMWLFWAATADMQDGRMGVWAIVTDKPESAKPSWSKPVRIGDGIMKNRPTVTRNGDWLLTLGLCRDNKRLPYMRLTDEAIAPYTRAMISHELGEKRGSNVFRSTDQGKTFHFHGQARVPSTLVDEHMIVERRDGSLWMLVRTSYGIGESVSTDGGRTWSPGNEYMKGGVTVGDARFFIRRLQSGALLMVMHDGRFTKTRSHMAAFVSDDDGATWQGGLMLDERARVTYPDGVQAPDGTLYVIYDFERGTMTRDGHAGSGSIVMATFREEDVRAGRVVTDKARLKAVISRLK